MVRTFDGTRKADERPGLNLSERILLLSPSLRTDEYSTYAKTKPPQDENFSPSLFNQQNAAALVAAFAQLSSRPYSPPSTPTPPPNPPANTSSGGGGIGGASTINPSGGGGGGGGGGGPGLQLPSQTQLQQMLSGASNNVQTPHAMPVNNRAASPPSTAFQTTYSMTAPPQATIQPQSHSLTTLTANRPPSGDPLYVLDLNTGETIPAKITLNTFSTWSENLLAQVSGGSVQSVMWNTSQAPDLTNISGQGTLDLQGTWAGFTGAARTDILSVTETPQSGSPLTQTMTFDVAATSSPAYSPTRPTSSSTWPTVVTPDQLTSGQATQAAGPYASIGLADGSVQTSFAMPSYNLNTTPVTLDYNSTTANVQPIFLTEYQLPFGQAVPSTITAQLTFNNTALATVTYDTSALNPGDIVQMALQANATTLSTGRYPWSITVTNGSTPTNYSGSVDIVNQANSPFGAGWSLDNVEQLVPVSGGVMLVQPGRTSLWFANNGSGGYTTPAGDFSTLTLTSGVYTRTLPDGTTINFNSSGQETSTVDTNGNTTTFNYTGNLLTSITDMNGQTTTLAYTNGLLTSITDPASRTATIAYTGSQLSSITDPGGNVWNYGYDASNDMTTLTDPNTHTTTFAYNFADRVSSVTQPDGTTEQLTAEQMNGLAAPGTGTPTNPATAVLLATGDQAQFTDANSQVWLTNVDWLGFGQGTVSINPDGDTSLIYRDANGLPWMSSDPLGRRTREFFNSQGDATEIVNPDDSYSQYSYNSFSEPTQYTDPTGNTTTYTYNSKGDLTQKTDALGYNTTYAYNTAGLVTSTTDPLGNVTDYSYNALNDLTGTTNALNQTTTYAYTNAGQLSGSTDAMGYSSTFSYNALNQMTGETLPDSSTTNSVYSCTYDKVGNKISATDPLGYTTNYSYNAVNEMTTATNALNQTTTFGYDGNGNEISVTNPLNQTTTYSYNAADKLVGVTNALDYTTTYGYDAAGEKISATNPLNQTTTYSYTLLGQLATTTDPLGDVFSYSYNANGDNTAITQSGPSQPVQTTTMSYNALNEQTNVINPLGFVTSSVYDANRNLVLYADAYGNLTKYAYNAVNELTQVTDAQGNKTAYTYNANGEKISVTDPLGNTTSYTFDAQGRELTATAPNGGTTAYKYDVAGNLLSLTDPVGNVTSYSYNAINELVSTTNPLGYQSTNAYNAAGELTSATDANGHTIDFSYNAVGQQTSQTWVGGNYTATYDYNAAGQLTSASDPFSSYTYTYDAAGRETSVSNAGTPGVPTVTLSYGYDAYNNRTSLTDSLGGSLSYTFDARQLLTGETLSLNGTTTANVSLSYNENSLLTGATRSTPSGDTIAATLSYDSLNRLTGLIYTDQTKTLTLANYQYSYNAGSELSMFQDSNGNALSYRYDANGELTGASGTLNGSNYSGSWTYDANGNRNMAGYVTGTGNELKSDGTYNYTYDKNGNTLTQTNIATGSVTYYSWDYQNRLTEVKQETSTGTVINDEKFTYDVLGNRIGVSLNGTQQLYTVYDGSNPYMDFNGSGQLTERYLTNPNALSQYYGQVSASGTTQWFLTDNINSIRQVISTSGSSLDALTYDPFGNIVSQTNAANAPRMMFAGGAYDSLMGTTLFNKRYYNSGAGDWMSSDPSSFAAGDTNLYRYAYNAPSYRNDPSGLQSPEQNLTYARYLMAGNLTLTSDPFFHEDYSAPSQGYGWGQPGFGESFIPVWGSFRAANDHYANGRYGWATFYTLMTASDVVMVGTLVKGIGTLGVKLLAREVAAETTAVVEKEIVQTASRESAALAAEVADEEVINAIRNVPTHHAPFTPDQVALQQLVEEATLQGRKPLTVADAEIILDLAQETNYPGWRAGAGDLAIPSNWTANPVPHIHLPGVGRGGHVPVQSGVIPR